MGGRESQARCCDCRPAIAQPRLSTAGRPAASQHRPLLAHNPSPTAPHSLIVVRAAGRNRQAGEGGIMVSELACRRLQ